MSIPIGYGLWEQWACTVGVVHLAHERVRTKGYAYTEMPAGLMHACTRHYMQIVVPVAFLGQYLGIHMRLRETHKE